MKRLSYALCALLIVLMTTGCAVTKLQHDRDKPPVRGKNADVRKVGAR